MSRRASGGWLATGLDFWMLGLEANRVIALRLARIAAGGKAGADEAQLMVAEKVRAGIELQTRLMTGALGTTPVDAAQGAVRLYRGKVAANTKRLARKAPSRK